MRYIIKLCCFLLLLLSMHKSFAQDCNNCDIDSLYKQINLKKSDGEKVRTLERVILNYGVSVTKLELDTIIGQLISLNAKSKTLNAQPYIAYREAMALYFGEKYQLSLDKFKVAIDGFDKQKKVIIGVLTFVRLVYNSLNRQEERYQFYTDKLNYYLINGPIQNAAACYHGLGGYFVYKGNYDQAISNYLKSAELFKNFSYPNYMNEITVIGVEYAKWGNFDKASYYLSKTLSSVLRNPNPGIRTFPLMALSNISLKRGEYEKAFGYADEAANVFAGKPLTRDYAISTLQKAIIYLSQHEAAKAYPLLIRSKGVSDTVAGGNKILTPNGELETDFGWYLYNKETNKRGPAQTALLAAYNKAVDEKSNDYQLKYLRELSQWFISQNESSDSKLYLEKYYALNDVMQNEQNAAKVAHYENEQKEQRQAENINNLRQEKAVQAAVINKSRMITFVSLTALLLITGAIVFIYRQLRTNKKTLTALKQTQTQLIQSEKMASLGELTAGIAHEIQNPLNFVNNFSEVSVELVGEMNEELDKGEIQGAKTISSDLKQNLQKIQHHGKRADFIVKGMLEHSRANTGEKQLTDMNVLCDEFLNLSYHGLRAKDKSFNAEIVTHFDPKLPRINVSQQDMGRVMLNLFNNAFYAVNEKKKTAGDDYMPKVSISTFTEKNNLVIKVKDNGKGIPESIKEKIMQPFFTTKPTGEGTGLGLSLSYDIVVKGHGGNINVNTKEGAFTEFTITLPLK